MSDKKLIDSTFEKANLKVEEKKSPREKRVMAVEQKEKAIENLRKGRETSLKNRKAKAAAKAAVKTQGVPMQDPVPAPVQAQPPVPARVPAPVQVQAPPQVRAPVQAQPPVQADAFETPDKQKKRVSRSQALLSTPTTSTMKETPTATEPAPTQEPMQAQMQEEQDTRPHTVCTWGGGGGGLWQDDASSATRAVLISLHPRLEFIGVDLGVGMHSKGHALNSIERESRDSFFVWSGCCGGGCGG